MHCAVRCLVFDKFVTTRHLFVGMQIGAYWLKEGTALIYCVYPVRKFRRYYVEQFVI